MAETTQDTVNRLAAFISQNYTDIETSPGSVISELLIKLAAVVHNEQYNKILELSQGAAISTALATTDETYSAVMDNIASNYNTYRSTGTSVKGRLKITVADDNSYNLINGTIFIQPALGLSYTLIENARVSPNPTAAINEIMLHQSPGGLYHFFLDVEATAPGPEYQVSSGTSFVLSSEFFIRDLVKIEAYGNFSSGTAIETDKQLVAKIKSNIGNSRLESASGIANKFKEIFPGFQYLSVCGANDAEMVRDKQNCFGLSTFGKADVYVRSGLGPEVKQISKRAKKLADGVWELILDNSDIPGFYSVQAIIPKTPNISLAGTLHVQSTDFEIQFYQGQRKNEILRVDDARFTKYQKARIVFNYTDSPAIAVNAYADFEVHALYQPNILEMQDILLDDETRLACADYLVKAVIPCMVSLNIGLIKKRVTDTYDSLRLAELKKDIFNYINTIPFGTELHASNIIDLCHNYDIRRVDLPIKMSGVILCPDNSIISIDDTDVLTIPYNLPKGVTPKTTAYFIDYYRIDGATSNPIDNIGITLT